MRLCLPGRTLGCVVVVAGLALGAASIAAAQSPKTASAALPGDLVYLRDVDPTIVQDIRYATANNFTGRTLAGYEAGECIVKREVAAALGRVQQELKPRGLSLKVFDCYRPQRASRAMLAWANGAETPAQKRYYPKLNKRDLFGLGYIAAYSGHSTGAAVDLTIVDLSADERGVFDPAASYADCTQPAATRAPEGSIDMGTGYDCFDAVSHTNSASITPEQRKWRLTLKAAMARQGLVNYFREWWHFSLPSAGRSAFDFPIRKGER
jgi:zinc D-Ala-D-Ala dipeptidase